MSNSMSTVVVDKSTKKESNETMNKANHTPKDEELNKLYFYVNHKTGEISGVPLKVSQIVLLLCPASYLKVNILTESTLLIGYSEKKKSYSSEGWKKASTIPILREVCAHWHVECSGKIEGPLSVRDLAENEKITENTRVWSSDLASMNSDWKPINDIPHLRMALQVFEPLKEDPKESILKCVPIESPKKNEEENEVAEELEKFLSSVPVNVGCSMDDEDDDEEEFESDGGTAYTKDASTGQWIPRTNTVKRRKPAAQPTRTTQATTTTTQPKSLKRKRKTAQFASKKSKCWIYVTNLPLDTNEDEVCTYFSRAGVLDLDPETQRAKIKLYKYKSGCHKSNTLKGDASLCYARPESVDLAIQVLDETYFRATCQARIKIKPAKFEQKGEFEAQRNLSKISNTKRKVAKLAAQQAVDWDEGLNGRIGGGKKGLRIIVLKYLFTLDSIKNDDILKTIESYVHATCSQWGTVEKITIFSKNPEGPVVVKLTQPAAASIAVDYFTAHNCHQIPHKKIEAIFWDGVTDYTNRNIEEDEKEEENRLDEFGAWLDNQELPDELKPRIATA